jgi:5-formyltetrahydrofolate cyclo-ligase
MAAAVRPNAGATAGGPETVNFMHPRELKIEIRRRVRERLAAISGAQREALSAEARGRLEGQRIWREARSVLFFAPLPDEIDVWPLLPDALAQGKTVALPRFDSAGMKYEPCRIENLKTDLEPGKFGIREPAAHCIKMVIEPDLVLVPGVAFDLRGRRLGRGRGFYDRLLAEVRGTSCAIAFDEQIVEEVPVEPHDVHLDCILTPTRWIEL